MPLEGKARDEFLRAYAQLLVSAWTDDDFVARLGVDPVAAARECGIEVPSGATLTILREIPDGAPVGSEDGAVALWESGAATGEFVLSVPASPAVDSSELTEDDLLALAAGFSITLCCCCPCCCCA